MEHEEALRTARESSERRCEEEKHRLQKQLEPERVLHKAELDRLALKLRRK
jgi:hypothetical protein